MANETELEELLFEVLTGNISTRAESNGSIPNDTAEGNISFSLFSGEQTHGAPTTDYFAFGRHVPELPNTISGKIITGMTVYDATFIFVILLFVARVKDQKIIAEKQPIFIPKRPVRGFRKYAVLLETGHSPAGGTTSGVFIRLCGRLTKSPAVSLSWRNEGTRQLFWSQNKDIFILCVPHYLGYIEAIEVMTDAAGQSPPWFLRGIRVLCLDNRKCWKSKVHAWLRGDRKPFSFRASLIGALSTREYMKKVFLQNHSWTMMWKRTLGSSFTCAQRCAIQWTSVSIGIFGSHFLMYKWPYDQEAQFDKDTGLRIPMEYILRGDDAVSAGVLGALAGAIVGMVIRGIIRQITSAGKWARVDDKDDFAHLFDPDALSYSEGAVVIAQRPEYSGPKMRPFPPCVDDTVLKILDSLSPKQVEAVKKMVNCGDGPCDMRVMMETGTCCEKKTDESEDPKLAPQEAPDPAPTGEAEGSQGIVPQDAVPIEAGKRGYRKSIAGAMNSLWDTALGGIAALSDKERSSGISEDEQTVPGPSAGVTMQTKNEERRERKYRKNNRKSKKDGLKVKFSLFDQAPKLSARASDTSTASKSTIATIQKAVESASLPSPRLPEDYDSLSDPESDEEIVTKAVRTSHEINLRRRPQIVYENAPWWDDRHRVYVAAPGSGNEHHQAVNERYERTAEPETACCKVRAESTFGEDAILNYLDGDHDAPPGGVEESSEAGASGISALALLVAIALVPFVVYERLPLPNAHALYYLYAVILCLVFHSTIFCTADGMTCAVMATWARRRRIARVRDGVGENEEDAEI